MVPLTAMMKEAIMVLECPGSKPCKAPSKIAVGMKTHRLVAPCWISSAMGGISGANDSGRRGFWRTYRQLQIIVFGKVHTKVPGEHTVIAQIGMNDDATDIIDGGGNTPRGIAQMAARLRATGAKLAHDTGETLGPVTGPESASGTGCAQNINFFGTVGNHRIEVNL